MLFANYPQGSKSFEKWSQEISEAAQLIDYDNYNWQQAAVDAIILQTSNPRLRERALQENVSYDTLINLGVSKEQSVLGAQKLEKASGQGSSTQVKIEEEVRKLRTENKKLRSKAKGPCTRCGNPSGCTGKKCPANGQKCGKCHKMNHYAKVCRSNKKKDSFGQISSAEESDSDESCAKITVGKLNAQSILAKIHVTGPIDGFPTQAVDFATDTGISKTVVTRNDWFKIRESCKFVKTSKKFRPYGTHYHLPIKGKALVTMTAERGAAINTWVYVCDDAKEQSLLGEMDARRLGIVKLNLKGEVAEVDLGLESDEAIRKIDYQKKPSPSGMNGSEPQAKVDQRMDHLKSKCKTVFLNRTRKCKGSPIKI